MGAEVYHQLIMLKTMQAGVSGYARLQSEAGRQLVQINLRGLGACGGLRAFWYAGDGLVRELGSGAANPRGEAGLYTQLPADSMTPGRLTALLITDPGKQPRPLAIGLCTAQSAGSLTDAKNVLLALCERLCREASETGGSGEAAAPDRAEEKREAAGAAQAQGDGTAVKPERKEKKTAAPDGSGDAQKPAGGRQEKETAAGVAAGRAAEKRVATAPEAKPKAGSDAVKQPRPAKPPREVFLPAIDVRQERRRSRRTGERCGQTEAVHGCHQSDGGSCCGESGCKESRGADDRAGAACVAGAAGVTGAVGAVGAACVAGAAGVAGAVGAAGSACAVDAAGVACAAGVTGAVGAAGSACAVGAAGVAAGEGGAVMQQPARQEKPRPLPRRSPAALPADRLPRLRWPVPFQTLAECFERCPPVKLMDWIGWRFVEVQTGGHPLWIGRLCREDRIASIAYVLPADVPAPGGMPFRRAKNAAGESVQALVLKGKQG